MHRVVVVDDEPEFCKWAQTLLAKSHDFHLVGAAYSGAEAIRLVELLLPDVVLLDVYMRGQDGFETARYLRKHLPSVKCVLISSHEDTIYQQLAVESGALAFIPKRSLSLRTLRRAMEPVA